VEVDKGETEQVCGWEDDEGGGANRVECGADGRPRRGS